MPLSLKKSPFMETHHTSCYHSIYAKDRLKRKKEAFPSVFLNVLIRRNLFSAKRVGYIMFGKRNLTVS